MERLDSAFEGLVVMIVIAVAGIIVGALLGLTAGNVGEDWCSLAEFASVAGAFAISILLMAYGLKNS